MPLAGGLAGACGWFVSFPLDLVKARMQGALLSVILTIFRLSDKKWIVELSWLIGDKPS